MNVFESFLQYEKENKLYDREVLGFKYWEYVRFVIYTEVKIKVSQLSELLAMPNLTWKNYRFNLKELNKYLGLSKIKKCDLLFISHPRRINQSGKYENIYTDEVEKYLSSKYKCLTFEEPCWNSYVSSDKGHLFPTTTENIRYTDILELSYLLKKKIYKFFNKNKIKLIEKEVINILCDLNNEYNVDIMYLKDRTVNSIIYGLLMKQKYFKILKKTNPKAVLINYWPTDFKTLVMDICNDLEIPTVELQHGTITFDDPIEHKCYDNNICKNVSDYFFSFGKVHTDENYLTTKPTCLKEVGYPFLEKKVKEKYKLPVGLEKNKKYILIISQTIIGEEMSEFASRLADLLMNNDEYRIIFKFHPNEVDRKYSNLEKKNIIQIKQKGEEIYKYQNFSYLQVGVYSTAIYEGLAFGIPTFILRGMSGSEESEKLLSYMKKGVYFINDEKELYDSIQGKLTCPLKSDIDKLWKHNSLKNIEKELEKLLKK